MIENRCPFAERINAEIDNLYNCKYEKPCDNQVKTKNNGNLCGKAIYNYSIIELLKSQERWEDFRKQGRSYGRLL